MSAENSTTTVETDRCPEVQSILAEASRSLALLDADGLEALALRCAALLQCDAGGMVQHCEDLVARREMAIFVHVLEATKANLNVMRRLRNLRTAQLEYSGGPSEYGRDSCGGGVRGDH